MDPSRLCCHARAGSHHGHLRWGRRCSRFLELAQAVNEQEIEEMQEHNLRNGYDGVRTQVSSSQVICYDEFMYETSRRSRPVD